MSASLAKITLDEASIKHRSPEVEHERAIALTDLLHDNHFVPAGFSKGPYDLKLSVKEGRLVFDIKNGKESSQVVLAVQPFKHIVRDYFLICESYYEALKGAARAKIEAIDGGRRGIHNEGAELLKTLLKGRVDVDFPTARRLFTLICVLHIK